MTHRAESRADQQLGAPRHSWCSVYDGQRCLGHVISRGRDGVEAFDRDDKSIGTFPTQRVAVAALMEQP
jgi:hypothetical protein